MSKRRRHRGRGRGRKRNILILRGADGQPYQLDVVRTEPDGIVIYDDGAGCVVLTPAWLDERYVWVNHPRRLLPRPYAGKL